MPANQTYGIGLLAFGTVLFYSAIHNKSIGAVIQGDTSSKPSVASQLADSVSGSPSPAPSSAPAASAPNAKAGTTNFDGKPVANWIYPLLVKARASGIWKGTVNSGYRSVETQTAIYNNPKRNGPAAKPGESNHNFTAFPGGAVDVTDAPGLAKALASIPGGNLLVWAGAKDNVHFSHPHNGGY